MSTKLSDIGEFGLIRWIQKEANKTSSVLKGIGDDAAVISVKGKDVLLFTTDMMTEGVHFTKGMPPALIGQKALGVNISDIAAMGGTPRFAVVSLGVSPGTEFSFVKEIYKGINRLAKRFNVAIVGGDTVRSQKLVINIALLGEAKKKNIVLRSGAQKGDVIFTTGTLGRSLESGKHLSFTPRVSEAQFLVKHFKLSAMIDISDGLIADLGHILEESSVGADIYEACIPRAPRATLRQALYDGEDFELLFTLSPGQAAKLKRMKHRGFSLYPIGKITDKKNKLRLVDLKGHRRTIKLKGFCHF